MRGFAVLLDMLSLATAARPLPTCATVTFSLWPRDITSSNANSKSNAAAATCGGGAASTQRSGRPRAPSRDSSVRTASAQ